MSTPLELLSFLGTILVAAAYVPKIAHLIRQHCAYGISVRAWLLWLVAALLILPHALTSGNWVFATLQVVNLVAILFITVFSHFHTGKVCLAHKIF